MVIPRDFAVHMTWFPEKVWLYRVCAYIWCGCIPVRLYKVFIRLQTSSRHIAFKLQAGVVAVAGTLCW